MWQSALPAMTLFREKVWGLPEHESRISLVHLRLAIQPLGSLSHPNHSPPLQSTLFPSSNSYYFVQTGTEWLSYTMSFYYLYCRGSLKQSVTSSMLVHWISCTAHQFLRCCQILNMCLGTTSQPGKQALNH